MVFLLFFLKKKINFVLFYAIVIAVPWPSPVGHVAQCDGLFDPAQHSASVLGELVVGFHRGHLLYSLMRQAVMKVIVLIFNYH